MTEKHSSIHVLPSCAETSANMLFKYLEKVFGLIGECLPGDNKSPKCMYFQDSFMKDMFNFYPERVCIDCTYKKFQLDLYTILILCEDSNGRSHIIAVGFLQSNDVESFAWLFSKFKTHNPNWRKIKSFAVDPGIQCWQIIKDMFSDSIFIICSFHAIKAVKKYINVSDTFKTMTEEQKNCVIEFFERLLYAPNVSEFEEQFKNLCCLSECFASYLLEVWWPEKDKWRILMDFSHEDVFKNTNLYLEELNNALQLLFESESNYIEYIKKLFFFILLKKREKPSLVLQPVTFLYSRFSTEYQICKTLTPYAAKFVIEQLDLSQEMTTHFNALSEYYVFNYLGMEVQASATSCQCNFFRHTRLPCRHIFCVRKVNYFCYFDGANIEYNWSMQYSEHVLACMDTYLSNSIDSRIPQDVNARTALASHLFEITPPLLLDIPKDIYESRIKVLKSLVEAWKVGSDTSVKFTGIQKTLTKTLANDVSVPANSSNVLHSEPIVIQIAPTPPRQRLCDDHSYNHCVIKEDFINLTYVLLTICLTKESCINWLNQQGFLPQKKQCYLCQKEMQTKSISWLSDGVTWWCSDKKCVAKNFSVRLGTWFEESNLTLQQMLILSYMWIHKFNKEDILFQIAVSDIEYVKWDKYFLRICNISLHNDVSTFAQAGPSTYKDPLDKWLENHVGKDIFLEFLKDAAYFYEKDKETILFDSSDK